MPTRGFSVRLFFPTGEPRGLRIIERSGWTGQGVAFPRAALPDARNRDELKRTGVYVLWDRDPAGAVPEVYIGQSDNVLSRLIEHEKNKDFWTDAIAFTSKDDNFNSAHARFIESQLIQRAKDMSRAKLTNSNEPSPPHVSEADANDAQHFMDEVILCLPIIGLGAFEPAVSQEHASASDSPGQDMFIDYRQSTNSRIVGILASGFVTVDGFLIREGSQAATVEVQSFSKRFPRESALRTQLIEQGILKKDVNQQNAFRFTRDYVSSSPSRAAGIISGRTSNGREDWKDAQGRSLNDLAKLQSEQAGDDE